MTGSESARASGESQGASGAEPAGTVPTSAGAAVPATSGPLRFEALVDRAKTDSARRWNTGFIVTGGLLVAVAAAGIAALVVTGFGSWFTIALVAVFGVAAVGMIVTSVLRGRILRVLAGPGAVACRVTDTGVTLANSPEIAWGELVFVGVLNDRPRTNRLKNVPVYGWAGRAALKAGNGTILCELAVRDGEALRARFTDPAGAKRVSLYGRFADGTRRGLIPLLLDAVLSEETTQAVVSVLFAEAAARGIPHSLHENAFAFTKWKGPQLDPAWPAL
ncbi:hypothetical protein [Agromyces aerolatus]|uniref:hypothetical protein n=1 Tax=Agromyces sp. LY-1074 TaxID=3074080 RepID=UPI002860D36A|nr:MULTISPECIES: hypothetical protein [unclassified Agromyces]MDR5698413.1 hypothetical protein [Agromyces sp. LY-1074]MDR5704707.1 hypothetical protein [Agromyces sp. LY-1358]